MKPVVDPLDYSKSKVKDVDINSYFVEDIREINETPDARAAFVHNVGCPFTNKGTNHRLSLLHR